MSLFKRHGAIERNCNAADGRFPGRRHDRRDHRDRTAVLSQEHDREGRRGCVPTRRSSLAGRNIYIREGCYVCHSQMIRPFRDEVERYGHYSLAAESMYDHPFQWGSKRTGPDLARVGGRYSDEWHVEHLKRPRNVVPESIMPTYAFLLKRPLDTGEHATHLKAKPRCRRALHRRHDQERRGRSQSPRQRRL